MTEPNFQSDATDGWRMEFHDGNVAPITLVVTPHYIGTPTNAHDHLVMRVLDHVVASVMVPATDSIPAHSVDHEDSCVRHAVAGLGQGLYWRGIVLPPEMKSRAEIAAQARYDALTEVAAGCDKIDREHILSRRDVPAVYKISCALDRAGIGHYSIGVTDDVFRIAVCNESTAGLVFSMFPPIDGRPVKVEWVSSDLETHEYTP